MTFITFSLQRELKFLNDSLLGSSFIVKATDVCIKRLRSKTRLKVRTLSVGHSNWFPSILLSNGGVVSNNSDSFGRPDTRRLGLVLFEDSYTERGRWGRF